MNNRPFFVRLRHRLAASGRDGEQETFEDADETSAVRETGDRRMAAGIFGVDRGRVRWCNKGNQTPPTKVPTNRKNTRFQLDIAVALSF